MLQQFSSIMLELYEMADQLAWDDYQAASLALVGRTVRFDTATLGCGAVRERRRAPPGSRDTDTGAARAVLSSSFHLDLPAPVVCSGAQLQQFFDASRLEDDVQRHGVRQLLLLGSPARPRHPAWWLLLGRRGHQAFSVGAALYVSAVWPHLLRCNEMCLRRYLASKTAPGAHAGVALLGACDAVQAADDAFERLAQREWPGCDGGQLPAAVLARLRRDGRHEGRIARWSLEPGPAGASLCRAAERLPADALTHAEAVAAWHYAQGQTHGEIAALLGVSSNTVRTHLAHVFSKLDIHRKSELPAQLRQQFHDTVVP